MTVRLLTLGDLPAAMELCTEAGWNQTIGDWRMLLERDSDTCFGMDVEGELAATTTLVSYGTRLGWIGMVLTRERFRRRGYARILLEHTMEVAAARRLETLKLDAAAMGAPLYESLGFAVEQPVERWLRGECGGVPTAIPHAVGTIPQKLDTQAFGVDRTALLQSLALRSRLATCEGAYAMTRPGRMARYLGPCTAADSAAAQSVIEAAIGSGGPWCWDLLPANAAAVGIAQSLGFAPVRRLQRMSRGAKLRARDDNVFALAGFELG